MLGRSFTSLNIAIQLVLLFCAALITLELLPGLAISDGLYGRPVPDSSRPDSLTLHHDPWDVQGRLSYQPHTSLDDVSFPQQMSSQIAGTGVVAAGSLDRHKDAVDGLTFITATSSTYFHALPNLISSLQYWESELPLVLFDLGMTPEQKLQVSCWKNVRVVSFDFRRYPTHIRFLFNFGWKALVIDQALHLHNFSSVLYLDAGLEVRRPLDPIRTILRRQGYFLVKASNVVPARTHPETMKRLGYQMSDFTKAPFCAAGIEGYVRGSTAAKGLLSKFVACSLDPLCLNPPGSGRNNHNFDQSALSSLAFAGGFKCHAESIFYETDMGRVPLDPERYNDVVLSMRRWFEPKPYVSMLQTSREGQCARFASASSSDSSTSLIGESIAGGGGYQRGRLFPRRRKGPDSEDEIRHDSHHHSSSSSSSDSSSRPIVTIEHGAGAHIKDNRLFAVCEQDPDGDECARLANEQRAKVGHAQVSRKYWAYLRGFLTFYLRRRALSVEVWVLVGGFAIAVYGLAGLGRKGVGGGGDGGGLVSAQ